MFHAAFGKRRVPFDDSVEHGRWRKYYLAGFVSCGLSDEKQIAHLFLSLLEYLRKLTFDIFAP